MGKPSKPPKPPKPRETPPKNDSQTKENRPAASRKSTSNTGKYPYLDTFNNLSVCGPDKDAIEIKCKSEEGKKDSKDARNKTKTNSKLGAVFDRVKNAVLAMDEVAKKTYGYGDKEKTDASTAWINDHCDGLWFKPNVPRSMTEFKNQLEELKKQLNQDCFDIAKKAGMKIVIVTKDAAIDYGEKALIREVASLPTLVFPVVGEAVVVGVTVWNIVDGVWTAGKTAINTGAQAIEATRKILELRDQVDKINDLLSGKMSETEIFEETMTAIAEVNPCLRARKCRLVPYNKTDSASEQANTGEGCCPGQTGHHIIPDSAAQDAGCRGYTKGSAPVICLEGASNNHGSHGRAHQELKILMDTFNGGDKEPYKDIYRGPMVDAAMKSISASTLNCSRECLIAQLNSYYTDCRKFKANPGTGGPTLEQTGTPNIK